MYLGWMEMVGFIANKTIAFKNIVLVLTLSDIGFCDDIDKRGREFVPDISVEDKVLKDEPGDVEDDEEGEGGDAASLDDNHDDDRDDVEDDEVDDDDDDK